MTFEEKLALKRERRAAIAAERERQAEFRARFGKIRMAYNGLLGASNHPDLSGSQKERLISAYQAVLSVLNELEKEHL